LLLGYPHSDHGDRSPSHAFQKRQDRAWIGSQWSLRQAGHAGIVSRGADHFLSPNGGGITLLFYWGRVHTMSAFRSRVEATPMYLTWTNYISSLLAIFCLSALIACGSLASCLNRGFVSVACGGGYGERDLSSSLQPTTTSVEGRWTDATLPGRTVAGLVLDDSSDWLFYTARDNPNVLAGLIQGLERRTLAPSVPRTPKILIWKAPAFARRPSAAAICQTKPFRGRSPTSRATRELYEYVRCKL